MGSSRSWRVWSLIALAAGLLGTAAVGADPAGAQGGAAPACGTPTPPTTVPTPVSGQATPPSPNISPLGRLGRWNGTTFAPVKARSLSGGHLYVLVHGWAAGFNTAVDSYPGPGPLLAWYPQAINAQGQQFLSTWYAPMAKALTSVDPKAVVVAFSWLDRSATPIDIGAAKISEANTVPMGAALADGLNQAMASTFTRKGGVVHLIAHSHGSKVATLAALALRTRPRQLTLFDSPDTPLVAAVGAQNDLVPELQKLKIGRGANQTFVDNYTSIFGCFYGNEPGLQQVVDVQLVPSQYASTDVQARHLYPPNWYIAAADDISAKVGPAWSPLLGTTYKTLGAAYVQSHPGGVSQQLALTQTRPAPGG